MIIADGFDGVAIGFTGRKRAGKTTAIEFMTSLGFEIRATRTAVMNYISQDPLKRGNPDSTERQQYWGNQARVLNGGNDVWMPMLLEAPITRDVGFDSVRYPDQDRVLRDAFRGRVPYILLAIDAPPERRCYWAITSTRPGSPRTPAEFEIEDNNDWNGCSRGVGQNVEGCFAIADVVVNNDGSKDKLREDLKRVVYDLRRGVYSK